MAEDAGRAPASDTDDDVLDGDGPPRPLGRRGRAAVIVGAALATALRLAVSLHARYPRVVADEPIYLAMARLFAGGSTWNLGRASTYATGYSVLLTPWFTLDLDPDAIYRAAVVTNAVLGGFTVVAVEALVRRLTPLERPRSVVVALLATSLPALAFTSGLAWSDSLTPLVFALLALACLGLVERPSPVRALVAVAAMLLAVGSHNRFLPLVAVVVGTLVVLAARRRLPLAAAAGAVAVLIAGLATIEALNGLVYDRLYEAGGQVDTRSEDLDRILRIRPLVLSGLGQTWALLATTAGIAGVGAIALGRGWFASWRRPARDAAAGLRPATVGAFTVLLALVGLAFATSVGFMTDQPRSDHLVYTRYNDAFVAPLVALGLASLLAARTWRARLAELAAVGAIVAGAGAVLWAQRADLLRTRQVSSTIFGVMALEPDGPKQLPSATVAGVVLVALVAVASLLPRDRLRRGAVLGLAVVLLATGMARVGPVASSKRTTDPRHARELAEILPPGVPLHFLISGRTGTLLQFYQYPLYLPGVTVARRDTAPRLVRDELVIADAGLADLSASGYRLAWVDATSPAGLWVAPSPLQDEMDAAGELLPAEGLTERWPRSADAGVSVVSGPEWDGGHLRATLRIDRPDGPPWPTVDRSRSVRGRVRIALAVVDPGCDCVVERARADLGGWVPGDVAHLDVEANVNLLGFYPGDYTLVAQVVREDVESLGPTTEVPFTVPRMT